VHSAWLPQLVLPYLQANCSETSQDFFELNNPSKKTKFTGKYKSPEEQQRPQHLFHSDQTCFVISKIVETVLQGCYSEAVVEYLALMTADWVNVTRQWFETMSGEKCNNILEMAIVHLWSASKSLVVQASKSSVDKSFVFKSGILLCQSFAKQAGRTCTCVSPARFVVITGKIQDEEVKDKVRLVDEAAALGTLAHAYRRDESIVHKLLSGMNVNVILCTELVPEHIKALCAEKGIHFAFFFTLHFPICLSLFY